MEIDPQSVKSGFDALKVALETFKSIRDMVRGDPAKYDAASVAIDNAEREVKFAEAQLAQALGYQLCRAHFPPKPMLLHRYETEFAMAVYSCPDCGREEPPIEYFNKRKRVPKQLAALGRREAERLRR